LSADEKAATRAARGGRVAFPTSHSSVCDAWVPQCCSSLLRCWVELIRVDICCSEPDGNNCGKHVTSNPTRRPGAIWSDRRSGARVPPPGDSECGAPNRGHPLQRAGSRAVEREHPLGRRQRALPFFRADTGAPVATPRILSTKEL
jgi:hypothetical protein